MADPRIKTLKIKTGVVKRLTKEKIVYEREAELQKKRVEKLKEEKKDEYDIRKQEEVLQESLMMIPDCQRRLLVAYDELNKILDSEADLNESEDYIAAKKIVEEAKPQLPNAANTNSQFSNDYRHNLDPRSLTLNKELQTIYNSSNDELWIESWLSQQNIKRAPAKPAAGSNVSIHGTRIALNKCSEILSNLTSLQTEVTQNVNSLTTEEWNLKMDSINQLKLEYSQYISSFTDPATLLSIKKAIFKRKKKRNNKRKSKEQWKIFAQKEAENRNKLHKEIDHWLENMKEEAEKVKKEEIMKKDADCVLAEVTKKKSDARKQLSLITALIKLRSVRESMGLQRGEKMVLEDKQAFNITTEKLLKMWGNSIKNYGNEEQNLRSIFEQTADQDTKIIEEAKEKQLFEEWQNVLFGEPCEISMENTTYWALTASDRDLETFIAIRKSWDTFLVSENDGGSQIPIGWVLPKSQASWLKYLKS